jgi:hypothetical protein
MILKIEANKLVLYFLETKMIFWFVSIQFKHICYINEQKNSLQNNHLMFII